MIYDRWKQRNVFVRQRLKSRPYHQKSITKHLWRGLGSTITPIRGGPWYLLGHLTFTESHDPDIQPTPKSEMAIDNRATLLRHQAKLAEAGNHLFDDVASMTYTFL
jgi:hypothetical protein